MLRDAQTLKKAGGRAAPAFNRPSDKVAPRSSISFQFLRSRPKSLRISHSQLPSPRRMRALFGLQLIALIIATVSSALGADSNSSACYFVNGAPALTHVPCFPEQVSAGGVSACCYISNGDVCLDTGICLSTGGLAFQGACTDQNWLSNSCPHRCPDRK